jgi:hypothetical protein
MAKSNSMRKVWMGAGLFVAALSFFPAWSGSISWWMPGIGFAVFAIFALEPLVLTWEVRRRNQELQITDEGILRRLARGDSEFVRWSDLREISILVTQGANYGEDYAFVLAGTGSSGVLVGQSLAARHDLVSHLNRQLPGFDHRRIDEALAAPVNHRVVLWRAAALEGESNVVPIERALRAEPRSLH